MMIAIVFFDDKIYSISATKSLDFKGFGLDNNVVRRCRSVGIIGLSIIRNDGLLCMYFQVVSIDEIDGYITHIIGFTQVLKFESSGSCNFCLGRLIDEKFKSSSLLENNLFVVRYLVGVDFLAVLGENNISLSMQNCAERHCFSIHTRRFLVRHIDAIVRSELVE